MESHGRIKNIGLRGVPVADTRISYIDGKNGILLFRGYRIEELAEKSSFTEVAYLLLHGRLPNRSELTGFREEFAAAGVLPQFVRTSLERWPSGANPMDVLQAAVPLLAMADPELAVETRAANVRKAVRVLARLPAVIAAWYRIRRGLQPLPAAEHLPPAADFLRQLHGAEPDPELAKALDIAMILHAEHTFNASTFACREVVSTRAHLYAGVAAGVGALSGPLHGGANARVMQMLDELESQNRKREEIGEWVGRRLDRGEKIMGMGHAVYKTLDPRAQILKGLIGPLSKKGGREQPFLLLTALEEAAVKEFARRGKPQVKANVDFYSGLLYSLMEIPTDLLTPIFVMALACGWCAHIIEEKFAEAQERPALYRPKADYVGDYCGAIGCVYPPMAARG